MNYLFSIFCLLPISSIAAFGIFPHEYLGNAAATTNSEYPYGPRSRDKNMNNDRCSKNTRIFNSGGDKDTSAFEPKKVKEMDEFIWSLSLEPTDESRRDKLAAVIATKYNDNEFCELFDQQIIELGDVVKERAATAAEEAAAVEEENETALDNKDDDEEEEESTVQSNFSTMGQLPETKQLWAMIDLMVQKKTLVKRARESEFQ